MVGWQWLLFIPAAFGLPSAAVGAVLRLCEWGWGKPAGDMGSRQPLGCGALLCLPAAWVLISAAFDRLR
jgi:hypothetical protein